MVREAFAPLLNILYAGDDTPFYLRCIVNYLVTMLMQISIHMGNSHNTTNDAPVMMKLAVLDMQDINWFVISNYSLSRRRVATLLCSFLTCKLNSTQFKKGFHPLQAYVCIALKKHPSLHPFIFCLSGLGSHGQEPEQRERGLCRDFSHVNPELCFSALIHHSRPVLCLVKTETWGHRASAPTTHLENGSIKVIKRTVKRLLRDISCDYSMEKKKTTPPRTLLKSRFDYQRPTHGGQLLMSVNSL